jgi:hypothetical protein
MDAHYNLSMPTILGLALAMLKNIALNTIKLQTVY